MKKIFLAGILSFVVFGYLLAESKDKTKYWIYFKDKGENFVEANSLKKGESLYNLAKGSLSERAIKRRQQLAITEIDYYDVPVCEKYINNLSNIGVKTENISKWFNAVTAYLDDQSLEEIEKLSFVLKVKPVVVYKSKDTYNLKEENANTSSLINKVTNNLDYGDSFTQNQLSNIPKVHDLEINGSDVLVGVLDTGFDWKKHVSLKDLKVLKEYDFVFHDEITANEVEDAPGQDGHGTLCFSVLAGYAPCFLIGPAYNSEFLLAKTENMWSETKAEEDNWVVAIEWMEALGVDVTSTSLGYFEFNNSADNYTYEDMDGKTATITIAANIASAKGVTVVVGAGNEGNKNWRYITAPADGLNVITVGAVWSNGSKADFSSVGPTYDGRIKPDVAAMGVGVYHASGIGYYRSNGTSLACPIIAGIATLIKSARPELTPVQIREALRSSGSQALSPDNGLGWGIVDAYKAITYHGIVYSNKPIIVSSFSEIKISTYIASRYTIDKNSVKLFYSSDSKNYSSINMQQDEVWDETNTGKYSAVITKITDTNQDSLIYYYFTATDEQGERRHPFNAPENINILETEIIQEIPNDYLLYQNYPNPFNPSTEIKFGIKAKGHVKLYIYNSLGQIVTTLLDRDMNAGTYTVRWDGLDRHGKRSSSGAYYYNIQVNGRIQTKKMLLLK